MSGLRRGSCWFALALALALASVLSAVAVPAAALVEAATLDIDRVVTDEYPQVQLEVTAPGDVTPDDPAAAFTVIEDGEQRSVQAASRLPSEDVQTVLLIDTSGSMGGEPIAAAARAATAFLDRLPSGVAVAIVGFGGEATTLAPFAASDTARRAAIDGLEAAGQTALYDGVAMALAAFPEGGEAARSIVLLSDGGDTVSATSLDATATALADSGVRLQAIELRSDESDPATLARLAEVSGGRVVAVDDADGLDAVYTSLASQLVNRFRLTYESEGTGETAVQVRLEAGAVPATAATQMVLPAPTPTPSPAPSPTPAAPVDLGEVVPPTGLWSHPLVLPVGGAAVFLGLLVLAFVLLAGGQRTRRLAVENGAAPRSRSIGMAGVAEKATLFAERQLERRGRRGALNAALENAGLDLRPGEFLVLAGSAAVAAFAIGFVPAGVVAGTVLAVLALVGARLLLSVLASRRRARFAEQLGDLLQLLAGSLRAGYGLLQAIDAVSRESDSPTSDEFSRVVIESRLGRDVNQSLRALAERMQSEDFEWVVQAIEIHREVGGDLAEVLDTVAGTIRERDQIRRQVKALSAEGRLSGYILLALPFGVAGIISLVNPSYLSAFTDSVVGLVMLAIAGLLMVGGAVWIRKLVRLVF